MMRWAWLALPALMLSGQAAAQLRDGQELPWALQGIAPATGMCRRDGMDGAAIRLDSQAVAPDLAPQLACAASFAQVRAAQARPETLIADLREPADFRHFHIEGALNLDLGRLLSKPYWRDRHVVLVGDGKAQAALYQACARLQQAGYRQVRVLRGGMPMWLAHGQPTVGFPPAVETLIRLSPAEMWLESRSAGNLVVIDPPLAAMREELPSAVVLQRSDSQAIRLAMDQGRKARRGAPLSALVWVSAAPPGQQWLLRQSMADVPLLVYDQGREPLQRQMAVQQSVWAAHERGPRQPGCGL